MHTRVLFWLELVPDKLGVVACCAEAESAVWHAFAVWQTLHPVPVQPSSQVQPVTLGNEFEFELALANERLVPWKMVPPQPGWAQVEPPKPGGQSHDEPLATA